MGIEKINHDERVRAWIPVCTVFTIALFIIGCGDGKNSGNSSANQPKVETQKTEKADVDIKMSVDSAKRVILSTEKTKSTGRKHRLVVLVYDPTSVSGKDARHIRVDDIKTENSLKYDFSDDAGFMKQIDSGSWIESGLWKNHDNASQQNAASDAVSDLSVANATSIRSITNLDLQDFMTTDQQKYKIAVSRLNGKLNTVKEKEKYKIWNSTYDLYLYSLQKNKAKSTASILNAEYITTDWDLTSATVSMKNNAVLQTYLIDLLTKLNVNEIKSLRKSFNTHKTLHIVVDQLPQNYVPKVGDASEKVDPNIRNTIASLQVSDFDTLAIFDVFKGSACTHGLKVYNVVKEVLDNYGLDSLVLTKVKRVPINYFSNKRFGDAIINDYNKAMADDDSGPVKASAQIPADSICEIYHDSLEVTSQDYLNALLYTELQRTPAVITNSYTIGCRDQVYVPVGLTAAGMKYTNLLTSATNKSEDIERYRDFSSDYGAMFLEPLFSYLKFKPNTGTIIVGDELSDSTYFGMYSTEGNNIDVVGRGTGWEKPNCTVCIHSTDTGASFATPEVAAKLYIAKALWKKNNLSVNAIEARTRLILATELSIPFINKFSSAGPVSMGKLLEIGSGYMVDNSNHIVSLEKVINASLYVNDNSGNNYYKFITSLPTAGQKQNLKYTRGLYYKNSRWFVFSNEDEKWEEVKEPYDMSIACLEKNSPEIKVYTLTDFKSKFKQFILLNNQP